MTGLPAEISHAVNASVKDCKMNVQKDDRIASRIARLLVVQFVEWRDLQKSGLVRLDLGIQIPDEFLTG